MAALSVLHIADPPERWEALGFAVRDGVCELGGVSLHLGAEGSGAEGSGAEGSGAEGSGITAWAVREVDDAAIDGLVAMPALAPVPGGEVKHPNGALGIDHVVVVTPDFDRTAAALEAAGIPLRRARDAGGFRQGFRRLGPAILELVESKGDDRDAPARFWGLVVIVEDLEALAQRLGDRLGTIRPAVQPGRKIATLRREAGLGTAVAFMDPES